MLNLLGKYYPQESFWHVVDPRCKCLVVVSTILPLFLVNLVRLAILVGIVAGLYLTAKIPLKMGALVIGKFKWLLLITLLVNLAGGSGSSWSNQLLFSGMIVLKLALSLGSAAWLSFVTKPQSLVDGLARWCVPFARVTGGDWALFIGLVVRFIPELGERAAQIIAAQRLRGATPGKIWRREQQWIKSTLIPIFMATLRSSTEVALAMEARGYRYGQPRTPWEELRFQTRDWMVTGVVIVGLMVFFYFNVKW